jgi:hypothetical protein
VPDRNTPERLLIQEQDRQARPRQPPQDHSWPASEYHTPGARAPRVRLPPQPDPMSYSATTPSLLPQLLQLPEPRAQPQPQAQPSGANRAMSQPILTARALKVTAVVDAGALLELNVRDGQSRVELTIQLPDRAVTADLSAKSLRKAIATVRENGPDNIALILQESLSATPLPRPASLRSRGCRGPLPLR